MNNQEIINKLYSGEELNGRELAIVSDILSKGESKIPDVDFEEEDILDAFGVDKKTFNQKHAEVVDFMSEFDELEPRTFMEGAMKFKTTLTEAEIYAICTIYLQLIVDQKLKETLKDADKEMGGMAAAMGSVDLRDIENPEEFIHKVKDAIKNAVEKAAESGEDLDLNAIIKKTIKRLKDDENN